VTGARRPVQARVCACADTAGGASRRDLTADVRQAQNRKIWHYAHITSVRLGNHEDSAGFLG
jgi:hypothetical protein